MKPIKQIGATLAVAAALGVVACDNGNLNAPDLSAVYSSAVGNPAPESSSTEVKNQPASSSVFTQSSSSVKTLSSSGKMETCVHFTDLACEPCPPGVECSCNPCDIKKAEFGVDCQTGVKVVCKDGEWNYYVEKSSSSVALSSSSNVELCKPVTDVKCDVWPCISCDSTKDEFATDCRTGAKVVCKSGGWLATDEICPNGRWTTNCNGEHSYDPVCCTEKEKCVEVYGKLCAPCMEGYKCSCNPCEKENAETVDCTTGDKLICKEGEWSFLIEQKSSSSVTAKSSSSSVTTKSSSSIAALSSSAMAACKHISDYDGMTAQGNCVNQNGTSAVDCVTGGNYQCKNNNWTKVSCLNIKPDECKPGMGGCGYRLCEPNGIKEIADCENSVTYVCNGESWVVKKTEENQRCARGELEYCNACFEEGKFEGHYQCVKGKWQKMGMGDEICEHITDLDCKIGEGKCGACDAPENKEVRDCVTGRDFVCQNGFWVALVVDCNALIPECGFSEYELCTKYNLKEYCNDKWLSEPCDGKESSRDLVVYENGKKLTNRGGNYICVNGKWIERFRYYECGEKEDCVPESVRCQASSAIGTACDNEGVPAEFDGCTLICSGGAYLYAPPPTW